MTSLCLDMAGVQEVARALPAPNFAEKLDESGICRKANLWSNILHAQNSICGVRTLKKYIDHDGLNCNGPKTKKQKVSLPIPVAAHVSLNLVLFVCLCCSL